jgi:ApeA N-terminal domain 1
MHAATPATSSANAWGTLIIKQQRKEGTVEAFEASGQWWLADHPDVTVSGTLIVAEDGRAELKLIGALSSLFEGGETVTEDGVTTTSFTDKSMHEAGVYPRILGLAGSKVFTLDDCFQTNWTGNLFGGGLGAETIRVHQVLEGVHFEPEEALEFTALVVHMDWLPYWVQLGGIGESITVQESDGASVKPVEHVLTIKPVETQEFDGLEGSTLKLGQTYGLSGDRITERRLTQDFYFVVEYAGLVPLRTLLSQAGALQNLVSIGTGKVAAFRTVYLQHPDVARTLDGKVHELPIELFAQWHVANSENPKYLSSYDMPFTLTQLGGVEGISKWLKAAEHHMAAVARVMSTRYDSKPFVGDAFLNCAAALEGYDRTKHRDDIDYVKRIKRCAAHAGGLFTALVGDTEVWAQAVKRQRNDVAHHNVGVESASTEQLLLSRSAYWLFVLCLLRDSGAPTEVFDNVKQHGAFGWLQAQLTELALV